jgi:hypothetical protein
MSFVCRISVSAFLNVDSLFPDPILPPQNSIDCPLKLVGARVTLVGMQFLLSHYRDETVRQLISDLLGYFRRTTATEFKLFQMLRVRKRQATIGLVNGLRYI